MKIPVSLREYFYKENLSCPKCSAPFEENGVKLLGILGTASGSEKDKLYVAYVCAKCNTKVEYKIFDMTLEELAIVVIDNPSSPVEDTPKPNSFMQNMLEDKSKKVSKAVKSKSKSKITAEEKKNAMDMLDSSSTWSEWLKKIDAQFIDEDKDIKDKSGFYLTGEEQEL